MDTTITGGAAEGGAPIVVLCPSAVPGVSGGREPPRKAKLLDFPAFDFIAWVRYKRVTRLRCVSNTRLKKQMSHPDRFAFENGPDYHLPGSPGYHSTRNCNVFEDV